MATIKNNKDVNKKMTIFKKKKPITREETNNLKVAKNRRNKDEKETKEVQQNQSNSSEYERIRIVPLTIIAVLFLLAMFISTYVIINYKESYVLIGVAVTVAILALAYLVSSILSHIKQTEQRARLQYEDMVQTTKASYMMTKKNIDYVMERIAAIEKSFDEPTKQIIDVQKSLAKITISRTKENTDALLNSNDRLLEKISEYEEVYGNITKEMKKDNQKMIDESNGDIIKKQQALLDAIEDSKEDMKRKLNELGVQLSQGIEIEEQAYPVEEKNTQKKSKDVKTTANARVLDDFSENEEMMGHILDESEEAVAPKVQVTPVSDDPNHVMTPDEIAALISGQSTTKAESEAKPEVEESVEPKVQVTPVSDDPNHVMTPDEIAALIAGTNK